MYAVVDIGSNTVRLKIYKSQNKKIIPIMDKKNFLKLVSKVDEEGNIKEEAILSLIETLNDFKYIVNILKIKDFYVFATEALRSAKNKGDILKRINDELQISINIITGEEEALYDYYGIRAYTEVNSGILVDIGGGSTELVFFKADEVLGKYSIPVGSLNSYSKYVFDTYPTKKEANKIENQVLHYLEQINKPTFEFKQIIGVGGTIRALRKFKSEQVSSLIDFEISYDDIKSWFKMSKNEPKEWNIEVLNSVPERVFTLTTGLIILKTIMKYFKIDKILISEYGVREGYLLNIINNKEE